MSDELTEGLDDEYGDDESGDDESGEDESGDVEEVMGALSRDRRFAGMPFAAKRAMAKKAVRTARRAPSRGGRGGLRSALRNSQVSVQAPKPKIVRKRVMTLNQQETVAAGTSAVITLTAEEDFFPKKIRIVGPSLDDFLVTDIKLGSESFLVGDDGIVASALASDDGFLAEIFQDSDGKGYKIRAQQRIRFFVTNRGAAAAEFAVHIPGVAHVELSTE